MKIKIGTRDSQLALWQAHFVEDKLKQLGIETQIVSVKSEGDLVLDKPLYEMGITGVFTKTLDLAMVKGEIDIAVHSMKDVPTLLAKGIVHGAVLERASVFDILVYKNNLDFLQEENATIGTGSLRRKAQWLNRYPTHKVENLRGNVNTRLKKLEENPWQGAIFASAGLDRISKKPENFIELDWMTPAPAQGAMMVVVREELQQIKELLQKINHMPTEIETKIERDFLRFLQGGCTAPIGAIARYNQEKGKIYFKGDLVSLCGKEKIVFEQEFDISEKEIIAKKASDFILKNQGERIIKEITLQTKKSI